MKISNANGMPVIPSAAQAQAMRHSAHMASQIESAVRRFDQISIAAKEDGESSFEAELKSRLKKEVCTATTTGDIAALRQQVQTGEYRPDPAEIARKILLYTEG